MMYGPQAAYSRNASRRACATAGSSIDYELASVTAGVQPLSSPRRRWLGLGQYPHRATSLACYIALCAVVSIIATLLMPDHTNKDISQERP
jgi:hypothetical protein